MIVIQPEGGLCNRMRAIASAHELSLILGMKLIILWNRDKALNCRFDKLFEKIPYRIIDVDTTWLSTKIIKKILRSKLFLQVNDEQIKKNRWKQNELFLHSLKGHVFLNTCQNLTGTKDFTIFRMRHDLKGVNSLIDKSIIGIHIRRTDNEMSIKYSPTHLFVEMIEKELIKNPSQMFYLATDDIDEENFILRKFPNHILSYRKRTYNRNESQAIEDAMVDLYHLSQCGKIYGSYYSSFSDVAALWGKIEKIVLKVNC